MLIKEPLDYASPRKRGNGLVIKPCLIGTAGFWLYMPMDYLAGMLGAPKTVLMPLEAIAIHNHISAKILAGQDLAGIFWLLVAQAMLVNFIGLSLFALWRNLKPAGTRS